MAIDGPALAQELQGLRKGRAMRHPQVLERLGPQAKALFGIDDADTPAHVRRKALDKVRKLLATAPSELKRELTTAALAALALHPNADQRLLGDREIWLAGQFVCEVRTARRRVQTAFEHLVDAAVEEDLSQSLSARARDDGLTVRSFRAVLRLDTPSPELSEHRSVVVTADHVGSIVCRLTVPKANRGRGRHGIDVKALHGVRIARTDRPSPEDFEFVLELPQVLRLGETHEYGLQFTVPLGQQMRPHYVFQPLMPCDNFDLTIQFDAAALPTNIWRLNGVPPRMIDSEPPAGDPLTPDRGGRVRLTFTELRQGFAYGMRWRAAAS